VEVHEEATTGGWLNSALHYHRRLLALHPMALIGVAVGLINLVSYGFDIIAFLSGQPDAFDRPELNKMDSLEKFWLVVIFAPLFETASFPIFYHQIIEMASKNRYLGLVVSALVFGFNHSFSTLYILNAIAVGVILAYAYIPALPKGVSLLVSFCHPCNLQFYGFFE
jgi:membrane protease YdiL (CAAX protease family)